MCKAAWGHQGSGYMVQNCDLQGGLSCSSVKEESHFSLLWVCFPFPQLCCFKQVERCSMLLVVSKLVCLSLQSVVL